MRRRRLGGEGGGGKGGEDYIPPSSLQINHQAKRKRKEGRKIPEAGIPGQRKRRQATGALLSRNSSPSKGSTGGAL